MADRTVTSNVIHQNIFLLIFHFLSVLLKNDDAWTSVEKSLFLAWPRMCCCVSVWSNWLHPDMSGSNVLQNGSDWSNRSCGTHDGSWHYCAWPTAPRLLGSLKWNSCHLEFWGLGYTMGFVLSCLKCARVCVFFVMLTGLWRIMETLFLCSIMLKSCRKSGAMFLSRWYSGLLSSTRSK